MENAMYDTTEYQRKTPDVGGTDRQRRPTNASVDNAETVTS